VDGAGRSFDEQLQGVGAGDRGGHQRHQAPDPGPQRVRPSSPTTEQAGRRYGSGHRPTARVVGHDTDGARTGVVPSPVRPRISPDPATFLPD